MRNDSCGGEWVHDLGTYRALAQVQGHLEAAQGVLEGFFREAQAAYRTNRILDHVVCAGQAVQEALWRCEGTAAEDRAMTEEQTK